MLLYLQKNNSIFFFFLMVLCYFCGLCKDDPNEKGNT